MLCGSVKTAMKTLHHECRLSALKITTGLFSLWEEQLLNEMRFCTQKKKTALLRLYVEPRLSVLT
jgi:hypothetical protein